MKIKRNISINHIYMRYESYFILIIIILGFILRIYNLGDKSLWMDEFFSLRDSEKLLSAIERRGHPPFYFMILHLVRHFGETEFILRFPSVIFGILTIIVIYEIGSTIFSVKEGIISSFLLSISIFHINYSQEVRMYSLFALLSLLSLFYFYKSIKENKKRFWVLFVIFTLLNLYTHYFAIFTVIVEVTFFIFFFFINLIDVRISSKKDILLITGMFILSIIIIFLLYLPWGINIIYSVQNTISLDRSEPSWIVKVWEKSETGLQLLPIIFGKISAGYNLSLFMFLIFFFFGIFFNLREFKRELTLLLLWVILPIILMLLISIYLRPIIVYSTVRYLIYILPIYLLVVSTGIVNLINLMKKKYMESYKELFKEQNIILNVLPYIFIMLIFISISISPLINYYNGIYIYPDIKYKPYNPKQDWKGAIQYIKNHLMPGDKIVIEPRSHATHLSYYFDVNIMQERTTLITDRDKTNVENITFKFIRGNLTKLQNLLDNRVWIIFRNEAVKKEITDWLFENYGLGSQFDGGIHVYLLQPKFFQAAIIRNEVWHSWVHWNTILSPLGASITIFDDPIRIDDIDLSEFKLLILADLIRNFENEERIHLKEHIQKGLIVIITGGSPNKIAGGTSDLTRISEWFGASKIIAAPKEERWKIRFEKKALDIIKDINLDREYAFYKLSQDWSTPLGCDIEPKSITYAYRVNDEKSTIFTHQFGNGTTIFIGPKGFAFKSPDVEMFLGFIQKLINYVLTNT